jgi:hypothetical protein
MQVNDLDSPSRQTKTVFQRRNGQLKVIKVPLTRTQNQTAKPMFPISKDRNEKSQ